jgi:hypothetical protein
LVIVALEGFRYEGQAELKAKSLRMRLETSTAIETSDLLVVRGGTVVLDGL